MHLLETAWQDVRCGCRALAKSPGFTLVAILTLALGLGANTAIFSVVSAVLLKPLPYPDPDRRVMIWSKWKSFDKTWVSDGEVLDYRKRSTTLKDVAAWSSGQANLTGDGEPIRVGAAFVTANTFVALGVEPLLGRSFTLEEDTPNNDTVVLLSHGLWQRRYGGNPRVVGRAVQINGRSRTVIGIMPAGFQLPTDFGEDAAQPTEMWMPLAMDMADISHGNHGLFAAARLAPGATPASATAELRAITANLTNEGVYPKEMEFTAFAVSLEDEVLGQIRPAILLLFGAVAFLLLIACANVANLLLARAEGRQREMALRSALGAGQWRLLRQLVTESLVLALASGAVGLAIAYGAVRALVAADPASVPRAASVTVDGRVLLFTAVVAIVTSVLFSLVPALRAMRVDLTESLKEGGPQSTVGGRRQRVRALLVIGEMALAVVLVTGAGLMLRSLWALQQIDLGFNPANVLTLRLSLPQATYEKPEQVAGFYRQLLDRVRGLPGVQHAGIIRSLPLGSTIGDWGLTIEGYVPPPGTHAKGDWQVASDGALDALGERLVRGRLFAASDTGDGLLVAMVNETLARTYWPGVDPIGRRMRVGGNDRPSITVVGVVGDVRHNGIDGVIKEKFYVPHSQWFRATGNSVNAMTLVVKGALDPLPLAGPIREQVRSMDTNLPVASVRSMQEVVHASMSTPRFTGLLLALFAALALTLSAVGIYGVLSYLVSQRSHEIGIRLAIGADERQVMRMVLGQGFGLVVAGVGLGMAAAYSATRVLAGLLHGVEPTDPLTFASVPLVLDLVGLVASYIPARRAARVDPLVALRAE